MATDVPEDRRIEFRIGVNLGDINFEDNDIYGDGVNVAARIESITRRLRGMRKHLPRTGLS